MSNNKYNQYFSTIGSKKKELSKTGGGKGEGRKEKTEHPRITNILKEEAVDKLRPYIYC